MKKFFMFFAVVFLLGFIAGPVFSQDTDSDGVLDDADNCIATPNGPNLGTCTSGAIGATCTMDMNCGTGGFCSLNQEDTFPPGGNGVGDACECEGDLNCDGSVAADDVTTFLAHFGRNQFNEPCTFDNPCYGDFDADGGVTATDVVKFLEDFGRSQFNNPCPACNRPVGVLFVVHGGTKTVDTNEFLWNAGLQQFSYDPHSAVYNQVIWNPALWFFGLQSESSLKFIGKYEFEYPRIGSDPFEGLTVQQLADMEAELDSNTHGIDFEVDWAGWMCGDCPANYSYPRFMYLGPDRKADGDPDPGDYPDCRYCGEGEPGGAWAGCDPDRYDVDGPVERLLKNGVYRIIMVDLTVGGVRFSKTYEVTRMVQIMLDDWKTDHGITIPTLWINDYSDLMVRSYPTEPAGWTRSLGAPTLDSEVLLNGSPNPVASDPDLATLQREAIEASLSGSVTPANTGVILMNHALHDENEVFDPKMNDTVVLNENIMAQLRDITGIPEANIIGARMGIKEDHPTHINPERTRYMRGENLGHQYLYETAKVFPSDDGGGLPPNDPLYPREIFHPWGYLYWDALDYLINTRGVDHIVIGFPQISTSSVLDMVEFPNQIGKEIGIKNWLLWNTWDCGRYTGPDAGSGICHPFADYWGNWVWTDCGEWELPFNTGTAEIEAGGTNPVTVTGAANLEGQSSGATGMIKEVIVSSGSWDTNDAAGTIVLKNVTGNFTPGETISDTKGAPGSALATADATQTISSECCFVMGGCPDDGFGLPRPYPPPRLTPLPDRRHDMDPSLAYALSEFGHQGYDPGSGAPNPNSPVQNQYTGTWAMYEPPDDDSRVGELLAKHVINAIIKPMVYLSNGEKETITEGESVTFEAHVVTGGTPAYSYAWSINKNDAGWTSVGGNSPTWTWGSSNGDAGTYEVRCMVTDSLSETGEVIWTDFVVSTP
jgi:hypothetical protein